jgi:uncharacterized protein (UPF0332 family)
MNGTKTDLIKYRLARAKETYADALILIENERWNSAINRLYYAIYYAVMALLLNDGFKPITNNGAKSVFSEHFVRTGKISKENGKVYSQLFTWRQKGDYDDLFDFDKEKVTPYIEKADIFLKDTENLLTKQ